MRASAPHEEGTSRSARLASVVFSLILIVFNVFILAPTASAVVTCADAGGGEVTVDLGVSDTATLSVGGAGIIEANGADCTGNPTNADITVYTVTGDTGNETFVIHQSGTEQFNPGADFAVDLLGGAGDTFSITGMSGTDTITLGMNGVDLNNDGNLDVTLTGVEAVTVNAGAGNDTVSGAGNAITGAASSQPLTLNGGGGNDTLTGGNGNDTINGGRGNDAIRGLAAADSLVGSSGNDLLVGGPLDDVLNGGFGDDALRGGLGTDTCLQGPGSGEARGCERFDLQPTLPIVAAFYYPWYPEGWTLDDVSPDTNYRPSLGFYDSADPSVIRAHIRAMRYGGIEVGISSWWGQRHPTDDRVARLLRAAVDTTFRWAIYYEPEGYGDPSIHQIRADLTYIQASYASDQSFLRIGRRPVIFVYNADDADCNVVDRWDRANEIDAYLVLKVFEGYRDCPVQPDGWHQYGPALAEDDQSPYSFTISPGFWKFGEDPRLSRDPTRWLQEIRDMLGSGARWQLVTTFNEWIEGTSVESAEELASDSGFGTYLDAMHDVILG